MEGYTGVGKAMRDVLREMERNIGRERVPTPASIGRVAAVKIVALKDSPGFPMSHMDGYAVRSADLHGAKTKLKVAGESKPERRLRAKLRRGEAAKVSTGSGIPDGADAVLPVERVEEHGGWVEVDGEVEPWSFIYRAGSDYRRGETLVPDGRRLRAQDVALLQGLGLSEVEVRKVPIVSVVATGSELTGVGGEAPGLVLNTHGPLFANMVRALGCLPRDLGIVKDDEGEISAMVKRALEDSDAVLTLGGTSVGRRDLVEKVVRGLDPSVFHHRLKMDRGRVSGVAVLRGKPLVMLPGPIQGAMNAFLLLAVPVLERLRGGGESRTVIRARVANEWRARPKFKHFRKVIYAAVSGKSPEAKLLSGETESMTILTKASGYVVVPESVTSLRRGTYVDVNLMPGLSHP